MTFRPRNYIITPEAKQPMEAIDYKIPKIEVKVEIAIDNGTGFELDEYAVYLNKFSRYRKGEETIFEFLNRRNEFIPIHHIKSDRFSLVNIDRVAYIREKEKFPAHYEMKIDIQLKYNKHIEVDHINPLPGSQSRVQDYINQDPPFLLFYKNEQKIFINKSVIIKISEQIV